MKVIPLKYYQYAVAVLAFLLPLYPRIIPPAIIVTGILSFLVGYDIKQLPKNKTAMACIVFYAVYALALLNSQNMHEGKFQLEVKLSLLIFPVILVPVSLFTGENIRLVYRFFILGCILACAVCFMSAFYTLFHEWYQQAHNLYNLHEGINWFLSSRFSYFLHPSYFSMYLGFALALLLFSGETFFKKRIMHWIIVLLFFGCIALLASKAGIIVLAVLAIVYLIKLRSWKFTLLALAAFVSVFASLTVFATEFANKFIGFATAVSGQKIGANAAESSSERVLIWDASMKLVSENPLTGVGGGDVKDELKKIYQQRKYTVLLEKELNAHNQFLETTLATGIIGLLVLIGIFAVAGWKFLKNRSLLGVVFVVIIIANFAVESMLENQAGVVFFGFWLMLETYRGRVN